MYASLSPFCGTLLVSKRATLPHNPNLIEGWGQSQLWVRPLCGYLVTDLVDFNLFGPSKSEQLLAEGSRQQPSPASDGLPCAFGIL